jgi:hypothetical protein
VDDLLTARGPSDDSDVFRASRNGVIVPSVVGLALLAAAILATRKGGGAVASESRPAQPPATSPESHDEPNATHATDVVDYTLRATLDPAKHTVHGSGSILWRNTSSQPVRELWLHLYMNAFKNERSAFLRERVGGRGSAAPEDWGSIDLRQLALRDGSGGATDLLPAVEWRRPGDDDETDARVPLPNEVLPGGRLAIDVEFDDKLPTVIERTGYVGTFHMVGQWFPKVARLEQDGTWAHFPFHHLAEFYADFGTYDVTLDVPADYVIGATGLAVETRLERGRRVERHVQSDVHDFAWTAWNHWHSARETIDGIAVTLLFPPGFGATAERVLAAVRFALPYLSARYGRYPYPILTVVHPQEDAAEAGGMEYPTLITTGGAWWLPSAVLAPEIVTVHELGHQWFYGLVATNEERWPFLDEGLNQFAEVDIMKKWRGDGSAVDFFGLRVSDGAVQAVVGNQAAHDEPVAQPAPDFASGAAYGGLVYARTAAVLETLQRVYGDEGVAHALEVYTRRYRFEHPGPEQLLSVFAEVLGEPVARNVRSAFFEKGWVDYEVESAWSRRAKTAAGLFNVNGARTTIVGEEEGDWEGGVVVRRRGTLKFPVDVELFFADGSTRRQSWDGQSDRKQISSRGPVALRGAVVDPDARVTVDANLANNHTTVSGEGGGANRSLERATYFTQLALEALSP